MVARSLFGVLRARSNTGGRARSQGRMNHYISRHHQVGLARRRGSAADRPGCGGQVRAGAGAGRSGVSGADGLRLGELRRAAARYLHRLCAAGAPAGARLRLAGAGRVRRHLHRPYGRRRFALARPASGARRLPRWRSPRRWRSVGWVRAYAPTHSTWCARGSSSTSTWARSTNARSAGSTCTKRRCWPTGRARTRSTG